MCLAPRSDEFEGQRSRSPGQKTAFWALSAACVRFVFCKMSLAASNMIDIVVNIVIMTGSNEVVFACISLLFVCLFTQKNVAGFL